MHRESMEGMKRILKQITKKGDRILDIGSLDVRNKGNYRSIVPEGCQYTGADIVSGPNVDLVMHPDLIPVTKETFNIVISGQCFEHVENPFILIKECARVLVPKGKIVIVAPNQWPEHHNPDRWRFLPDGMKTLFKHAGLEKKEVWLHKIEPGYVDCWGIAEKP